MLRRWILMCLATLVLCGSGRAQGPDYYTVNPGPRLTTFVFPPWGTSFDPYPAASVWGGAEYLLWWINDAPVPVQLITSNNNAPATVGQPGTEVLFGLGSPHGTPFGGFSGARLTLGGFLGDGQLGAEVSGFLLEQRSINVSASGLGPGSPMIGVPFFLVTPPPIGEVAFPGSYIVPNVNFPVTATVGLTSQMWGAEANGVWDFLVGGPFRLWALAGLRYLNLTENLTLSASGTPPPNPQGLFQLSFTDNFGTRNNFYGGQVGLRGGWYYGGWAIDVIGKFALGLVSETVNISGVSSFNNIVSPIGLFARPSNIGTTNRTNFTFVPELQCQVGYFITDSIRPFAGYNLFYVNNVVRPGNQIDRNLMTPVGGALPAPQFNQSGLFVQGLSLGVEIRY